MPQTAKRKRVEPPNNKVSKDKLALSFSDNSGDASEEDNDMLESPSSVSSIPPFGNGAPAPKKSKRDIISDANTSSPNSDTLQEHALDTTLSDKQRVEQLSKLYPFKINPPPTGRPIRIYCDGIYDLFHFGHAKSLEQAKKAFTNVYLLVGVCDDEVTHKKKGKTVLNEKDRAESIRHCKWADEVVEHAPWVVTQEFLDKHQIDYVAHDAIPYSSGDSLDVYSFVKEQGRFLPTQRTDGISTSDLITRIVRDYDQYVRRNLERGVSPKELNIGFLKEKELNMKKSISEIRTSIHQNWHRTKMELSHDLSGMFGAEGVVDRIFRRRSRGSINNETEEDSQSNRNQSSDDDPLHHSRSVSPVRRVFDFIKGDQRDQRDQRDQQHQ